MEKTITVGRLSDVLTSGIDVYADKERGSFLAYEADLRRVERPVKSLTNEEECVCLLRSGVNPTHSLGALLEHASRTMWTQTVTFVDRMPTTANVVPVGLSKDRRQLVPWPLRHVDGMDVRCAVERTEHPRTARRVAGALGMKLCAFLASAKSAIEKGYVDVDAAGEYSPT